ncbi:SRPBCC family protein [Piscinibacter sp. XHJ-5]|uniref:SRPBCC family protein n=1 Tax=Piscinibacter sp. XHJ-5 TaxID=3037797 RepID=UPI002452BBEA|nr:SRPBCC family protein [Piscinibacter sp. XHJ-5]
MATIVEEFVVDAPPAAAWDVFRDVGAVHRRLAPGFVRDVQLEEGARIVTFADGLVARELIVTVDDARRRLAYAAVGTAMSHHNASFQVFEEADGRSRVVWIADLLPETLREPIAQRMAAGVKAMQAALNGMAAR